MKQTDQWLHDNRDALITSLQNLIRFPSAKGPAAPGAPFGTAVRDCLTAALDLAYASGSRRIVTMPHYLFPGKLTEWVSAAVETWQQAHPDAVCFRGRQGKDSRSVCTVKDL